MRIWLVLLGISGVVYLFIWWRRRTDDELQGKNEKSGGRGDSDAMRPRWDPRNGPCPASFVGDIETIQRRTAVEVNKAVEAYVLENQNVRNAVNRLGGPLNKEADLARIQQVTGCGWREVRDAYDNSGWDAEGAIKRLGTLESRGRTQRLGELEKKLTELDQLRTDGVISDEEHAAMRKKALGI